MNEWGEEPPDIENLQGFVYKIRNLKTGRYYIGKKFFWSKITKPPLKGKTRKRHSRIESDWRDYWSSSPALTKDLEKYGKENFTRDILILCKGKFECAYYEAMLQFKHNVLFDTQSYNEVINLRLRNCNKYK